MEELQPRSAPRTWFADRTKRSTLLTATLTLNTVLVLLNVFDVFDDAPAWVVVLVVAIVVVLILPVLITVVVLNVRDGWMRREGGA